ncbi:hypothetical protein F5X68DRAFT_262701 [Plectosphaerella plurivora]|uniref:NmrA-like domain-containing protein n=1 Tax=Plectosphaerella plurivora TaxID=936078 RepID=A0A9P8V9S1_9PEZI|nr:hypothetical protein F5X68DRAFT_262701 [Plectosphaerella plurivora]
MATKIITILGITGKQGSSVAETFLKEGNWQIRGITRDPSKPASQEWVKKGVEMIKGDAGDAASLKEAFAGSNVIFGVTDFWGVTADPKIHEQAQKEGRPVNTIAYDVEVQQGKNIVDAANATIDTLDRFVLSTLSHTKKWSGGKYAHNFHFDAKWMAVEYLKSTYPKLAEKTSYLQVGLYLTNWQGFKPLQIGWPIKQADGTYLMRYPSDPNGPVAHIDARYDTGVFTLALVKAPAGQNLLGTRGLLSWSEFAALWGKVHGVEARFERIDRQIVENAIPGGIGEELADMFEYIGEFGYDGGDPTVVLPKDLGVPVSVESVEDYIRKEDWSSKF